MTNTPQYSTCVCTIKSQSSTETTSTFCHTAIATVAITHAFIVFIAISSLRIAGFFAVSESFRISSLTNAFGFRSVPTACVLACQGTASLHCKTFGTCVFHLLSTFIIIALFSPVGYVSRVCTPSLWLKESFFFVIQLIQNWSMEYLDNVDMVTTFAFMRNSTTEKP